MAADIPPKAINNAYCLPSINSLTYSITDYEGSSVELRLGG